MGRRSASKRTGMGKIRRISKDHGVAYEKWRNEFPTRGEVEDILVAYFERYDKDNVQSAREAVAYLSAPFYLRWRYALGEVWDMVMNTVRRVLRRETPVVAEPMIGGAE